VISTVDSPSPFEFQLELISAKDLKERRVLPSKDHNSCPMTLKIDSPRKRASFIIDFEALTSPISL